jgi:hypothetical protein
MIYISESDCESRPTVLQELWKKYNIKVAIDNTALAWDRVSKKKKYELCVESLAAEVYVRFH